MRYLAASTVMIVALSACPSDDEGGDTGADTGGMTSPTSSSGGMSTSGMSTSGMTGMETTESGGSTSSGESSSGGAPVINMVSWTQAEGCVMNTGSDVELVIDATDPDGDELTYSGMVTGCTPLAIEAATTTLLCPQAALYPGSVAVEDPDGNSDELDFEIDVCMDGSATP